MSLQKCLHEQSLAAAQLTDPALCEQYAREYGITVEAARAGAEMGLLDWLVEEQIIRESEGESVG